MDKNVERGKKIELMVQSVNCNPRCVDGRSCCLKSGVSLFCASHQSGYP